MTLRKPTIAIINEATNVSDEEAMKFTAAFQKQIHRDFAPIWGRDAHLAFVPKGEPLPSEKHWWLVLLDNADQAGALGYHDFTDFGQPLGKVFVETARRYGSSWQGVGSHEGLEMLGDPDICICALVETRKGPRLYAYENCDAVESDADGYEIDGVPLSDFVTPAWFEPNRGAQVDFKNRIKKPLELSPGGYISFIDMNAPWRGWQQEYAHNVPNLKGRGQVGSRRERRRIERTNWHRSTRSYSFVPCVRRTEEPV